MTRSHRVIHRLIWPLLAVTIAVGVGLALTLKPAAAASDRPPAEIARA